MSSGMIDVEVSLSQKVETQVHVSDVIQALNELPLTHRWNSISSILNHVDLNDQDELDPKQKEVIIQWLKNKIKTFDIQ